jgi:pyruvate formate lyase activating enzyme
MAGARVSLAQILDEMTVEGELYQKLEDDAVRCYACAHRCFLKPGRRGICQVRYNEGGTLRVPHGYVAALNVDPTEKKPFFHVLPGSQTLTFGMLGCDLHCANCQNWEISQTLRDTRAGVEPQLVTADQMIKIAQRYGAELVGSSYNEPLITSEWAVEVFKKAKEAGLRCVYISNGNATREVMEYLRPYLDGYKIDLKTMSDRNYRQLGAVLNNVLDGIRLAREMGFWVEVVTLVIPGFNDSNEELWDAARFLVSLSPDIPWHLTAFHRDYKMTNPDNTDAKTLLRAAEIGQEAGLHHVYTGNLPGMTGMYENTFCHNCGELLIARLGYYIRTNKLSGTGRCPKCNTAIAGIWK